MAERIRLRRVKGWRLPPDAVVVSRPSRWGNPYRVARHTEPGCEGWAAVDEAGEVIACYPVGRTSATSARAKREAHADAVFLFETRVIGRWDDETRAAARTELAGKSLACWCATDTPCHAAVLIELVNQETDQ
jgi:hypothetical protein